MILFFTELPEDVKLDFCFGVKAVIKDGLIYTFIGQTYGESARYEVTKDGGQP